MNRLRVIVVTFVAASLITIFLYEPAALFIYKLREPNFAFPIAQGSKKISIRNDAHGNGEFGAKRRRGRMHTGIDILAPIGTPVCAAKSGIAFTGNVPHGYGRYVMIAHPDGFQTIYGHLLGWNVVSQERVRRGEIVGFVGKTGNASNRSIQPHLHFEIRKRGQSIDPTGLLN